MRLTHPHFIPHHFKCFTSGIILNSWARLTAGVSFSVLLLSSVTLPLAQQVATHLTYGATYYQVKEGSHYSVILHRFALIAVKLLFFCHIK